MSLAHIHLLLNHFPTIGFGIGLGLLLVGLFTKSDELKRASLVILFVIAVLALPTYMSGPAAVNEICGRENGILKCSNGVSLTLIQEHEDWAFLAFTLMEFTGFAAWIGLWQIRRTPKLSRRSATVVLILSLITFGLMAEAANKGGNIRHPEIQTAQAMATAKDASRTPIVRAIGAYVVGNTWVWAAFQCLHFVGLSLVFTVCFFVNFRMLGMAKALSFAALYQYLPVGILGFGIDLFTGMLFFIATPQQYVNNPEFHRKVILLVLAGINVLYFILFDKPWKVGPGDEAPLSTKIVAATSLILWVGIVYYGIMLPFLGNTF